MIDVTPQQLATVRRILAEHVPECEVRAFGSRVTWTAKDYSDLDLAVVGPTKLEAQRLGKLREAFEESDLPFRVDVIDWNAIAESFRKVIEKANELLVPQAKRVSKRSQPSATTAPFFLTEALLDTWTVLPLEQACKRGGGDIQTGPFGSQLHASDYVDQGIPSVMPQNIGDNQIRTDGIARITPGDAKRLSRYLLQAGDIVYSRRGDVERRALVREREQGWLCGTGCLRVRFGRGEVHPPYAAYYLGHPEVRAWIVRHAVGATMPNLNTSILGALPFVLPPLPVQRAIAHILGTLDDKIDLNRRQNETLEAMARALFKSWFVDFGPVRAKVEGGGSGIPGPLSPLFPSKLMGDRPHGWEERGLDGIATYLNGLAMQKFPPDGESSLPVIKIAQLRQGSTEGADRASINLDPAYVVQDGDILFSWSGSLEVEIWCGGKGALNQHLFKVIPNKVPKWFAFMWTRHHLPDFRLIAAGKATTMGHIQRHHITQAKALLPGADLLAEMDKVMAPIFDQIVRNKLESRKLAQTRDFLLPRLLSGELVPAPIEVVAP